MYDLDNNPITHLSFSISPEGVSLFNFQLDCETGKHFSCDSVENLLVEAKHTSSGTWINIETGTIDLSTWNGTRQTFNGRITADDVSQVVRRQFNLIVDEV